MTATARGTILALADGLLLDPGRRGRRLAALERDAWPAVLHLANEELLTPALHAALREAGGESPVPADVRAYLAFIHDSNRRRNLALRAQALDLVRALNGAGIRPMPLKGVLTLFDEPRRDPAARIMADIDLAVPAESRAGAAGTLRALGYRATTTYPEGHHAVAEFMRAGDPGAVDLHVEMVDQPYLLGAAEVWGRARRVETEGAAFAVPGATDRILHALIHAQIHHLGNFYRGWLPLRTLYDFALLVRTHRRAADWELIGARMAEHHLRAALDSYLLAARRLFGLRRPRRLPPPVASAPFHYARFWLGLRSPAVRRAAVPFGNMWAAFARHRMEAKYGSHGLALPYWQLVHAWRFVARHGAAGTLGRLFGADRGACSN